MNLDESAWHGHASETMWAEPLDGKLLVLRNVPFFAYGLSYADVVKVKERDGVMFVTGVPTRSGHSTIRIFVLQLEGFPNAWSRLEDIGCTYERATEHLYAIDIPPESKLGAVRSLLEEGKREGIWDFEEGHNGQAGNPWSFFRRGSSRR